MTKCSTCNQDVVTTETGLSLNPKSGRLGRHLKDGTILTPDQIRDPQIRGYYEHHCMPGKTIKSSTQPEQTLF